MRQRRGARILWPMQLRFVAGNDAPCTPRTRQHAPLHAAIAHAPPPHAATPRRRRRSTAPSAFTGYAFHVVEALIVFANEVLVAFLLPLHMGLHRLYHIATTLIHLGAAAAATGD